MAISPVLILIWSDFYRKIKKIKTPVKISSTTSNDNFTATNVNGSVNGKKDAFDNEPNKYSDKETKHVNMLPGVEDDNKVDISKHLSRSRSCEDTLKKYPAQANLLEVKPKKIIDIEDNMFQDPPVQENEETQIQNDKVKTLPPLPVRRKRQPTIENSVCFQEVRV